MSGPRIYTLNEYVFDVIDTEEKAYWLGFLYADGSVHYNKNKCQYWLTMGLARQDYDHVEKWRKFLETNKPLDPCPETDAVVLVVYSKHLIQILGQYGIIPRKTYDHSVPVYIPPEPLTSHFWRGMIDGDGHVGLRDNCYVRNKVSGKLYGPYIRSTLALHNTNLNLLNKCKEFFKKGSIHKHPQSILTSTWEVASASLKRILPLLNLIYKDTAESIRLDRKYKKYKEIVAHASGS